MALHGHFQRTLSNPNSKVLILNKSCTEYFTKNTILSFQKSKLTDVGCAVGPACFITGAHKSGFHVEHHKCYQYQNIKILLITMCMTF